MISLLGINIYFNGEYNVSFRTSKGGQFITPYFMKFLFFFFLLSNINSIIINHSDVNTPEEKILSQYYKGKTIINESLFNSCLIVAPKNMKMSYHQ